MKTMVNVKVFFLEGVFLGKGPLGCFSQNRLCEFSQNRMTPAVGFNQSLYDV